MSYSPTNRNVSGIVFFGAESSNKALNSNANFTIDGTTLRASNLKIANGGNIGCVSVPDSIVIATDGDVSFNQDVNIVGNLTVNGTTTTVNSTVVTIVDPVITLGSSVADDNKDRGIVFDWHNGTSAKKGFFGFDDSAGKFTFVPDATVTSEVVTGSAGTIVATLEGNASTATAATALATPRAFSLTGEISSNSVNFDGSATVQLTTTLGESAITAQTELAEAPASDDIFLIYDTSATTLKKITKTNLLSGVGGGGMTSFTLSDGTTTQTIGDGNTLLLADSARINATVSATDTATFDLIANSVSEAYLTTSVAGDGLAGGNGTALSINVDSSTIEISSDSLRVKDGGIVTAKLADSSVTEVKVSRTIGSVNSSSTLSADINLCTAGAGITVTLPASSTGRIITIKKIDSAAGIITINGNSGTTIDGGAAALYYQYESTTVVYGGSNNWYII